MKLGALTAAVLLNATSAIAFEQDGFRSGMSVDEVESALELKRLTLSSPAIYKNSKIFYATGIDGKIDPKGPARSFVFCDDRLTGISASIDEGDFEPVLQDFRKRYGNPVAGTANVWHGDAHRASKVSIRSWYVGDVDRIDLSIDLAEEGLKEARLAAISFSTKSACWQGEW